MKTILLSLFIIVCNFTYSQDDNAAPCGWYGKKTVEERNNIFPFSCSTKIKLVSFYQPGMIDMPKNFSDYSLEKVQTLHPDVAQKFQFTIDSISVKKTYFLVEEKEISIAEKNELSNILCNYIAVMDPKALYLTSSSMCYEPHNAVLFLNDNDTVICYLELCFYCGDSIMLPDPGDLNGNANLKGCHGRYDILLDFFRRSGITYGTKNKN